MAVLLNADTGAVSGISGLTTTADNSGILQFQSSGTATLEISTTGNITIPGTGKRITGLFDGTVANRVAFQTNTANGNTGIYALPNGTGNISSYFVSNASDPTNASIGQFTVVGSSDVSLRSVVNGTGTYLPMTFYTGGSETARFSATAKTLILAGGSTSADGTGITFPATQSASSDANTLDDYEEGTWTPSLNFNGGTTGITYDFGRAGRYVKVGRIVTVSFYLRLTNKGSSAGSANVSGLPFPAFAGGGLPFSSGVLVGESGMTSMPTGTYCLAWSDSSLYLRTNGTSALVELTNGNFNNTSTIYGTVTYEAT